MGVVLTDAVWGCRYMSVLLHLNAVEGGGETSFPVADNRTYEEEVSALLHADLSITHWVRLC